MPEMAALQFSLNQRTTPDLAFTDFLDLAAQSGCVGVEPRTDLVRPIFDGLPPAEAGGLARDRGLRLLGLSEVHPFYDWTGERRDALARLIAMAHEAGAETISLIPRVDGEGPVMPDRAALHGAILGEIVEMLKGTSVVALVEPIGYAGCSVRHQRDAVAVIEQLGATERLGIIHDTFQHALAEDGDFFVDHIGLVHISGMSGRSGTLTDAQDRERVLVDETDRTGCVGQMRALRARGYRRPFSFECTAPAVQDRSDPATAIAASIAYLRGQMGETASTSS